MAMQGLLSSTQTQQLLGIDNAQLLRTWANEFSHYLSATAQGGDGKHRKFNWDDLAVLALVVEMREGKQSFESIHATLQTGERGEVRVPPEIDLSLVAASQQNVLLATRLWKLEKERDTLLAEVKRLEAEIDPAQAEIQRLLGAEKTLKEEMAELRGQLLKFAQMAQEGYRSGFKDGLDLARAVTLPPPKVADKPASE